MASEGFPFDDENSCCCVSNCSCRIVCQYGIHECECKTRSQKTRSTPLEQSSSSSPPPESVARPYRARGNTTGSNYHHFHGPIHPPRRPTVKDAFPTNFYIPRGSGRYPTFTPSSPEPSSDPATSSSPISVQPTEQTSAATPTFPFGDLPETSLPPAAFTFRSYPQKGDEPAVYPFSGHAERNAHQNPYQSEQHAQPTVPQAAIPFHHYPQTSAAQATHPVEDHAEATAAAPPRPSLTHHDRRLVSAGGDLPLSARPHIPESYLPAPEERGFSISREQYAALPAPVRAPVCTAATPSSEGDDSRARRPSWVKRMFSSKKVD